MNEKQFEQLKRIYGKEEVENHCDWVDPKKIKVFKQTARINGNQQDRINEYATQFRNGVKQKVPISVKRSGEVCMEGITRAKAAIEADVEVWVCTFMDTELGFTEEQWEDWQDAGNDHLGNTPATEDDMKGAISRRLESGRLCKIVKARNNDKFLDKNSAEDVEEYCKIGGKWFKEELYPNRPRSSKWFANRIEDLIAPSAIARSGLVTHTNEDLISLYKDLGGTKWEGSDFKSISGGEHVQVLRDNARISPNIGGSLLEHSINHPLIKQTIIISYSNLVGKEPGDIDEDRKSAVEKLEGYFHKLGIKDYRVVHTKQHENDKFGFTDLKPAPKLSVVES